MYVIPTYDFVAHHPSFHRVSSRPARSRSSAQSRSVNPHRASRFHGVASQRSARRDSAGSSGGATSPEPPPAHVETATPEDEEEEEDEEGGEVDARGVGTRRGGGRGERPTPRAGKRGPRGGAGEARAGDIGTRARRRARARVTPDGDARSGATYSDKWTKGSENKNGPDLECIFARWWDRGKKLSLARGVREKKLAWELGPKS